MGHSQLTSGHVDLSFRHPPAPRDPRHPTPPPLHLLYEVPQHHGCVQALGDAADLRVLAVLGVAAALGDGSERQRNGNC